MDRRGKKPDETQVSFRLPRGIRSQPVYPTIVVEFNQRTYAYLIEEPAYVIGRAEDSDICIQDANLSRYHARIERRGNAIWIQDLDSTNGVYLNDLRIYASQLFSTDIVTLGEVLIYLREVAT